MASLLQTRLENGVFNTLNNTRASRTVYSVALFVLAATLAQNAIPHTAAALCIIFLWGNAFE